MRITSRDTRQQSLITAVWRIKFIQQAFICTITHSNRTAYIQEEATQSGRYQRQIATADRTSEKDINCDVTGKTHKFTHIT